MKCPKCMIETQIAKNCIICEGDNDPNEQTRVFSELHMSCRNPQCNEFEKVVEIVREQINKEVNP